VPRAFTDQERDTIRRQLLDAGREHLQTYGIRKTNIEDLTRAAGISKGAFYTFFDSKEELFLEVLERAEVELREQLLAYTLQPGRSARDNFCQLLRDAFAVWEGSTFLRNFDQEDMALLVRNIPHERVLEHIARDDAFVDQVIAAWNSEGIRFTRDPHAISGLMKALFFVSLHRDDFGADIYPDTMELLIELVASYLVDEQ
jgi:AcrR family transcriptional regulator